MLISNNSAILKNKANLRNKFKQINNKIKQRFKYFKREIQVIGIIIIKKTKYFNIIKWSL
jgi:hypothetical protein